MKICIAFYKGTGNIFNAIIRKWTSSIWPGMLLSQFLPFRIKTEGKWYCSEWIAYALRISGVIDWKTIKIFDKSDLSPSVLYKIVKEMEYVESKKI